MMQPYYGTKATLISGALGAALLPILASPLVAYVFSMVYDLKQNNLGIFAEDLLIPPLGIIHGFIILFSD